MRSLMFDALGWVWYRQGRLEDAEGRLKHAAELSPKNPAILYHLGVVIEKVSDADAERIYTRGSLAQTRFTNPNRDALRRLYQKRKGSLEGFDDYMTNLEATDRARRREDIERSRIAAPKRAGEFALNTLDGGMLSLDSLKGKVAVINFWGTWCGPCVAEMPEFDKLAKQYATDSTVRVLTIDYNDTNLNDLRAWMQKKGYTFTTLIDDGYVPQAGIRSYPTTWFLDREGRIVFQKIGVSEKLVEEFGWRIEASRQPGLTP